MPARTPRERKESQRGIENSLPHTCSKRQHARMYVREKRTPLLLCLRLLGIFFFFFFFFSFFLLLAHSTSLLVFVFLLFFFFLSLYLTCRVYSLPKSSRRFSLSIHAWLLLTDDYYDYYTLRERQTGVWGLLSFLPSFFSFFFLFLILKLSHSCSSTSSSSTLLS